MGLGKWEIVAISAILAVSAAAADFCLKNRFAVFFKPISGSGLNQSYLHPSDRDGLLFGAWPVSTFQNAAA